jgi:nicotinamidase-related amidase
MMSSQLKMPLTPGAIHLCIDMQRLFAPGGPWPTPWMPKVLPVVSELAGRYPERTVFTRFITPENPEDMPGMWRLYYSRWRETTRAYLDPALLELLSPLDAMCPPAHVIDKTRYSAFSNPALRAYLLERGADGLIVTGSETDVCVLATVLDAVDLGFRVILVRDGICSSSDEGHDALLSLYHQRYTEQIETADADEILRGWPR